jgi:hypothetical protein
MINNDDEFAFPIKEPNTSDIFGMTLRDYFAAKALINAIGSPQENAEWAYQVADAMLERRKS